jgi:long-chain acyl-CoA synthetase
MTASHISARTINDIFFQAVERNLDHLMTYKQTIKWIPISSHELYRNTVGIARSLQGWSIQKGDRVAILSENRPEWAMADFACLMLGVIDVPIYPTLLPEQVAYILRDSGARVLFLSTADQLKKFLAIKDQTQVEKVVIMDYVGITEALPMHRLMHNSPIGTEHDAELDARARAAQPEDLATIMYTSGTTGRSKGVMLTHENLVSNLDRSNEDFQIGVGDVCISYLPLSHITARHLDYWLFKDGVTIAYCPNVDDLHKVMMETRPTLFVGVPRVYERIYNAVLRAAGKGFRRSLYDWAIKVGTAHRGEVVAGKTPGGAAWRLADMLLFSKVHKAFGGRVRGYISGGAPLGQELSEWYASVGIPIYEGYGLTETSPVIAINTPGNLKLGTVGKPLDNLECKIAADGEILVRGKSVFHGYWNKPEETRDAFLDGWFKTGDIGTLDADGFLTITDRKKDLIKTSGGKFIAPQPIEASLKANALVEQAVVIGDRRKFAAVVIVPHFALLEDWARVNNVPFRNREELVAAEPVQALYDGIVGELNKRLAQFETIKRVLLVPSDFSVASGELTPTMKLKRRVVEEKYKPRIDDLYRQAEEAYRSEAGSLK